MSKKHYIAIAEQIRIQIDSLSAWAPIRHPGAARMTIVETANRLCDVFTDENPRFDRVRFLAACGINR